MLEIVKMLEMMKMLELFSLKRGTVGAPYVKKVPQVALYLNLILLFSYGVAFGLCRFSYTFCFKVFLEIFFHFFGSDFSNNSNTVVVDFYTLVSFPVFVFGFADYNLLDKFVYQLWRQLRKLRNRFCFFNKTL